MVARILYTGSDLSWQLSLPGVELSNEDMISQAEDDRWGAIGSSTNSRKSPRFLTVPTRRRRRRTADRYFLESQISPTAVSICLMPSIFPKKILYAGHGA